MDKDSGNWTFSNNVTADYYYGDGSYLTGLNSTNASYYLASNPFSFYNVTTAPIYTNDTFAGNYSDFLDKITWGEATNGTLLTEETFTQTEFNTNYTANDAAYRLNTGILWSDAVNGTLLTAETFTQTEFNTNYTANDAAYRVDTGILSVKADTSPELGGYLDTAGQNIGSTADEIEHIYVTTNYRIYFGTGQEANIYYDGTHLVLTG